MHFAVVETGGKQYLVRKGSKISIETVKGKEGDNLTFDSVLLFADETKHSCEVGKPKLSGVKIVGKILSHEKRDKVRVVKFKNKVRYRRNRGHRQPQSIIEITSLGKAKD